MDVKVTGIIIQTWDCCWLPDMVSEVSEPWWCNHIFNFHSLGKLNLLLWTTHPSSSSLMHLIIFPAVSIASLHTLNILCFHCSWGLQPHYIQGETKFFIFLCCFCFCLLHGEVFWIAELLLFHFIAYYFLSSIPQMSASYYTSHIQNQMWCVKYCNWIVWEEILRDDYSSSRFSKNIPLFSCHITLEINLVSKQCSPSFSSSSQL